MNYHFPTIGICMSCFILIILPIAQPQPQCLTGADNNPCDGSITTNELIAYINQWYACSSCHPDIFNAMQAYFSIPFCGDWSCNATIGEDCSNDCGNCTAPQPNASFPQDYIAYWKFDGNVNDEAGVNNGSVVGNPQYVNGKQGQGLEFNGDYVDTGNVIIVNKQLTISAWINPSNAALGTIIGGNCGSGGFVQFRKNGINKIELLKDGFVSIGVSSSPVQISNWTHVAVVYNGSNYEFFINGIPNGSGVNPQSFNQCGTRIGSKGSGELFYGVIDELIIYNRTLVCGEIQQIYNAGELCQHDINCDDGNPCTINTCNSSDLQADARGCVVRYVNLGTQCNDGLFCTAAGTSACDGAGSCVGGTVIDCNDSVTCTDDSCNEATDSCYNFANDSNCNTNEICDILLGCQQDPCIGVTGCYNYTDSVNCNTNPCSVGTAGCNWNSSLGVCEDVSIPANAIFVDNQLTSDCLAGNYSITNRDCSGSDGDAYDTINEAMLVVQPGERVIIMGSPNPNSSNAIYNIVGGSGLNLFTSGTPSQRITIESYSGHKVIIKGDKGMYTYGINLDIGSGADYYTIKGLEFTNFDLAIQGQYYWLNKDGLVIDDCEFHDMNSGLVFTNITNFLMKDSYVHNCITVPNPAIIVKYGDNVTFINVESSHNDDGWGIYGDGDGFAGGNLNVDINYINCTANNNSEDGFDLAGQNVSIINSVTHNNGALGVKLWRRDINGGVSGPLLNSSFYILNLLSYNNGMTGISLSYGPYVEIYNSVFHNNGEHGIVLHKQTDDDSRAIFYNNIISENGHTSPGYYGILLRELGTGKWNLTSDYNIFHNNWNNFLGWTGEGTNSLIDVNPLFADESNSDFSLQSGSPAIDAGIDLLGIFNYDFNGISRPQDGDGNGTAEWDIGAYEF